MLKNNPVIGALTPSSKAILALSLASTLLASASAWGQSSRLPGDRAISDLEPAAHFQLEIEGEVVEKAEIYVSEREVGYLLVIPGRPAGLLISPRGKSVQSVDLEKLSHLEEGLARLEESATGDDLGTYRLDGRAMLFALDGKTAALKPRPPLTGLQSGGSVGEYDVQYAYRAEGYRLDTNFSRKALPVPEGDVRVRVYFGSWSEICEYLVPKIMRVEEDWKGNGVRFEYYGLPRPLIADPVAAEQGITGVPTAVVYLDDQEVGRLTGRSLDEPEESLYRILTANGELR